MDNIDTPDVMYRDEGLADARSVADDSSKCSLRNVEHINMIYLLKHINTNPLFVLIHPIDRIEMTVAAVLNRFTAM